MIEATQIRRIVADVWRESGLKGRGKRWRTVATEIQWILELEGSWAGQLHMSADAEIHLDTDVARAFGDDYPLRIFAEFLPTLDGTGLLYALDAKSDIDDDVRLEALTQGARELARFALVNGTLAELSVSYRRGLLNSMSIRRDLREIFENS